MRSVSSTQEGKKEKNISRPKSQLGPDLGSTYLPSVTTIRTSGRLGLGSHHKLFLSVPLYKFFTYYYCSPCVCVYLPNRQLYVYLCSYVHSVYSFMCRYVAPTLSACREFYLCTPTYVRTLCLFGLKFIVIYSKLPCALCVYFVSSSTY